jgi:fructokinase
MKTNGLVIFGEVLFDHFPDGSLVLGGAPFNVAWHLQAFAQAPFFISRVGEDDEGAAVRAAMHDWGMTIGGLQTDPELPTGRVDVEIVDGEPGYEIPCPAAFDAIAMPADCTELSRPIQLLYHGSLALRRPRTRETLDEIREQRPEAVFVDVNLRPPWWQLPNLLQLADAASWVKLNHHELDLLCPSHIGKPEQAKHFLERHNLDGLLLTHGEKGAELLTREGSHDSIAPNNRIKPVDTVGAGDAFTTVTILGLVHGWPLRLTLSRAQRFASAVCSHQGATTRDREFYRPFLNEWSLEN